MTKIFKPLTTKEVNHNKKFPDKKQLEPYKGFYIDEVKYPKEAKLWELLGYENIKQLYNERDK